MLEHRRVFWGLRERDALHRSHHRLCGQRLLRQVVMVVVVVLLVVQVMWLEDLLLLLLPFRLSAPDCCGHLLMMKGHACVSDCASRGGPLFLSSSLGLSRLRPPPPPLFSSLPPRPNNFFSPGTPSLGGRNQIFV